MVGPAWGLVSQASKGKIEDLQLAEKLANAASGLAAARRVASGSIVGACTSRP